MKTSKLEKFKFTPLRVAILALTALSLVYIAITAIIPYVRGDGLNQYDGDAKVFAERVLNAERQLLADSAERWTAIYYVDEVHTTSNDEIKHFCEGKKVDSGPFSYSATVITRQLLDYRTKTVAYDGCTLIERGDMPGGYTP